MKKRRTAKRYSEAFKRQVVRDIERGKTTPAEVAKQYGITGAMTIKGWLRRFGTGQLVGRRAKCKEVAESSKMLLLERRNRELEQTIARLTVDKVALESVVEEAQSHFGVDLKKTFGTGR